MESHEGRARAERSVEAWISRGKPDGRRVAVDILRRVATERAFAAALLRTELGGQSAADRGLVTEIVYGVLRRRAHLDAAICAASNRRMKDIDRRLHDVLRVGAYQLMFLDRVPAHAAVDTAVELAKECASPRCGGLVNAVLRRIAATPADERVPQPPPLDTRPVDHVAAVGSVSRTVADLLVDALGPSEAADFATASLAPAPLTLRTNLLRATRESLLEEVGGTKGTHLAAIRLPPTGALPIDLPCVIEGRATPQDEAAMAIVELLDPQPDESVLDVCAAPGGKTTHAAERMGDVGRIVATDRHPERLASVEASRSRLGLRSIEVTPVLPRPDEAFDRVLVDAPCSGLGTLRRHPEIRWRLTRDDVAALAKTQVAVLKDAAARVRPGGVLVYSVCTVTRAETTAQIAELPPDFDLVEVLKTGPHQDGAPDGFFAAKLVRRG